MFRFLIWRGSLCRNSPSAYIVETFFPGQKITGQYIFASDNLPGKRNFECIPPTVLWRNFQIFQKSTEDLFSRPKIFPDDVPHIVPDRRNTEYSIGGKNLRRQRKTAPYSLRYTVSYSIIFSAPFLSLSEGCLRLAFFSLKSMSIHGFSQIRQLRRGLTNPCIYAILAAGNDHGFH